MDKTIHIASRRIRKAGFLLCWLLLALSCQQDKAFERNLPFHQGWNSIGDTNSPSQRIDYEKTFSLKICSDKEYFVSISKTSGIQALHINGFKASALEEDSTRYFNLTPYIRTTNRLIVQAYSSKTQNFLQEIKFHTLNKIHFKNLEVNTNNGDLNIRVDVNNSYESDQQGFLQYKLLTSDSKLIFQTQQPVFLAPKTISSYSQKVRLGAQHISGVVECLLIINNQITDKVESPYVSKAKKLSTPLNQRTP